MKEKFLSDSKFLMAFTFVLMTFIKSGAQTAVPDVLLNSPLKEQLNYIEERTRIYENYRAIREDMFQKIKKNVTDTLVVAGNEIKILKKSNSALQQNIDSLNLSLVSTKTSLQEVTESKNKISLLGIETDKNVYNSITWIIIGGLSILLALGLITFKHNLSATRNVKKDHEELKKEFEEYRKTTREAREKMSMEHFNEIRRLKGG